MTEYEKRPLEIIGDISNRNLWKINVQFDYKPPPKGKKLKQHRAIREELQSTIPFFTVLDDYELYKIIKAVDDGLVPEYYKAILQDFYNAKMKNKFLAEIILGDGNYFPIEQMWKYRGKL